MVFCTILTQYDHGKVIVNEKCLNLLIWRCYQKSNFYRSEIGCWGYFFEFKSKTSPPCKNFIFEQKVSNIWNNLKMPHIFWKCAPSRPINIKDTKTIFFFKEVFWTINNCAKLQVSRIPGYILTYNNFFYLLLIVMTSTVTKQIHF